MTAARKKGSELMRQSAALPWLALDKLDDDLTAAGEV